MLGPSLGNSHSWSLQAGWEPDLWGRARRAVEGASDNAEASDADLAAARLAIQAEVANDYILLRVADTQQQLYARTVEAYQKSLQITQSQYRAGVVTRADVRSGQYDAAVDTGTGDRHRNRAPAGRTRHRGAVGQDAIAVFDSPGRARAPPAAGPGALGACANCWRTRRPDSCRRRAPRRLGHRGIGYAQGRRATRRSRSALSADSAAQASATGSPRRSVVGRLAPALGRPEIFDGGGLRESQVAQAARRFRWRPPPRYRQIVLGGFQEVEDNLAALNLLALERGVQERVR